MESHDFDALRGFIWLVLIWWWIWGRAGSAQEQPRKDSGEHRGVPESRDVRPSRAKYTCVATDDDLVLRGVRVDLPSEDISTAHADRPRTVVEEAMAQSSATPRSWRGYFETMRIWFRLANELSPDSK